MKARRHDSFWKESKAHNTRIKIPCSLSLAVLAINCAVPFSENNKSQRLEVKTQRKLLINTKCACQLLSTVSAPTNQPYLDLSLKILPGPRTLSWASYTQFQGPRSFCTQLPTCPPHLLVGTTCIPTHLLMFPLGVCRHITRPEPKL